MFQISSSPTRRKSTSTLAVLAAMGLLPAGQTFTHESIIGSRFKGRVVGEVTVGELPAIIPEIEGDAWFTGEHTFHIDDRDPFSRGFRL